MAELTASQVQKNLETALDGSGTALNSKEITAFVTAAVTELAPPDGAQQAKRGLERDLLNRDVVYALPDDALDLLPSLVRAAIAGFGKGPLAALPDLVTLLLRHRKLRVPLTVEEAAVLRVLKRAKTANRPPLSPAEIADALKAEGLTPKASVAKLLADVAGKSTKETTLVRETDGRWAIGNV